MKVERKEEKFIMSRKGREDRYPLGRQAEINKNFTFARKNRRIRVDKNMRGPIGQSAKTEKYT